MNGNFEMDKASYPFSYQRRGETYRLTQKNTQEEVSPVGLPAEVISRAAVVMNAAYWNLNSGWALQELRDNPRQLLLDALDKAKEDGVVEGARYTQAKGAIIEWYGPVAVESGT